MCLVVVKPFGVDLPSDAELAESFRCNSDGFGMAIRAKDSDKVYIRKGAMDLEDAMVLLSDIKNPKSCEMLLHFRIATEGKVCPENCHPYPISTKESNLRATSIITGIALAHNGSIVRVVNTERDAERTTTARPLPAIPQGATRGYQGGVWGYWQGAVFRPFPDAEQSDPFCGAYDYGHYYSSYAGRLGLKFTDTQIFIRDYLSPCRAFLLEPAMIKFIAQFVTSKFVLLSSRGLQMIGDFHEEKGRFYSNYSYRIVGTTPAPITSKKEELKQHKLETSDKSKGLNGIYLLCELCSQFVFAQETHEYEDMTLCDNCYKQCTENDSKIAT